MMIPCPECGWQDPIVSFRGYEENLDLTDMAFKVRCLKCLWEGLVKIVVSIQTLKEAS